MSRPMRSGCLRSSIDPRVGCQIIDGFWALAGTGKRAAGPNRPLRRVLMKRGAVADDTAEDRDSRPDQTHVAAIRIPAHVERAARPLNDGAAVHPPEQPSRH